MHARRPVIQKAVELQAILFLLALWEIQKKKKNKDTQQEADKRKKTG